MCDDCFPARILADNVYHCAVCDSDVRPDPNNPGHCPCGHPLNELHDETPSSMDNG